MSSHRRSFVHSGREVPSVPQTNNDEGAGARAPVGSTTEGKPIAGNRNGPGVLLDERA